MIKNVILIVSVFLVVTSCKKEVLKDYATFSGKIDNAVAKEIAIKGKNKYSKIIKLNADGTFLDTLHLENKGEFFMFSVGKMVRTRIYLKNNTDIKLTLDTKNFDESMKFSGEGSKANSYFIENKLLQKKLEINKIFKLKEADFKKKSSEITKQFQNLLAKYKNMDADYYTKEKEVLDKLPELFQKQYDRVNGKSSVKVKGSLDGKPSPEFNNYENFKGGTTSLKDLRGNYVYVDVWATWCGPCKREIPHLQKLEKEFEGKKIKFVSISVDKVSAKEAWRKMIGDKKMSGIQLFATQGDHFAKDYVISSIPRFILIDPKGVVVKSKMTRPSNPSTKEFLNKLVK